MPTHSFLYYSNHWLLAFPFRSYFLLVRTLFFFLSKCHQTFGRINLPSVKHTLLGLSAGCVSSEFVFWGMGIYSSKLICKQIQLLLDEWIFSWHFEV